MLNTELLIGALDKVITSSKNKLSEDEYQILISVKVALEHIVSDPESSDEVKDEKKIEQFGRLMKYALLIKEFIEQII